MDTAFLTAKLLNAVFFRYLILKYVMYEYVICDDIRRYNQIINHQIPNSGLQTEIRFVIY